MIAVAEPRTFGKFTPDADAEIKVAAKRYNLDPRFLRAVIGGESSGDWKRNNRIWTGNEYRLLPYIGVKDSDLIRHGCAPINVIKGSRFGQITSLARILSDIKYGMSVVLDDPMSDVEVAHIWWCGQDDGPHETRDSAREYANRIIQWMEQMGDF